MIRIKNISWNAYERDNKQIQTYQMETSLRQNKGSCPKNDELLVT